MAETRTKKSLINSLTTLFFFGINIPITFFMRRIYINYLGADILGLQNVIGSILGMINLAELGIGSAIIFSIYKPLVNRDKQKLNEIISIQGWIYSKISCLILFGAFIIALFFSYIFTSVTFPIVYTYLTLISFLIPVILSYNVNYRLILLNADQKNYKYNIVAQFIGYIKLSIMWYILTYIDGVYKYPLYLLVDVCVAITSSIFVEYIIKKEYPWLKTNKKKGSKFLYKYPILVRKTIQLSIHKLSGTIISNTNAIYIYWFVSLEMNTYFGNYTLLANSAGKIINAIFNSIDGGVGSIIAEGDSNRVKRFFWEYLSAIMFFSSIIVYGIICFTSKLIFYWIGPDPKYILPSHTIFLIGVLFFLYFTSISHHFLTGYGLFRDIWAPLAEAIINIGASILFGYLWGLDGIILGTIVSLISIGVFWKLTFLFSSGIKSSLKDLWINYIKHIIISWVPIIIGWYIFLYSDNDMSTIPKYILTMFMYTLPFVLVLFTLNMIFSQGFRDFSSRFNRILKNKL